AARQEVLSPGHRLCAGCGASIVVRMILKSSPKPVVVASPTGCLEVSTTIYPYTAWRSPFIHSAFENASATISGAEAAYLSLKRQGKIKEDINFVAFGGDGGTYDIGFQSLSGAFERRHNFVYVCYDNEAYMNTGIQRSGATPMGAWTTTSEVGKAQAGKQVHRKNLTEIMAAHGGYVAQASPSHWRDLVAKAEKAFAYEGPAFLNVLAPCPRGWRFQSNQTIEFARQAVETKYWPLYEVMEGEHRITYKPKKDTPVADWLKPQGRFKHLFKDVNQSVVDEIQAQVDRDWARLLRVSVEKPE
ncbi:MAG: thiamine pyrophosphate-dependent enzyme, partial [Actinomycetota bacterium]